MLIVLLAASLGSVRYHKIKFPKAYFIPVLLFGLMAMSLFWTNDVKNSMRGLERQLALVLIPLAFALMPSITLKSRNRILYLFAVAVSIMALFLLALAAVHFFQFRNFSRFFYHALVAPMDLNAIYVSVMVSLSGLFLLFTQRKTLFTLLLLLVHALFLVLLSSKIIIVTTTLIAVYGIIRSFSRKKIVVLLSILAVGILLLFTTSNPVRDRFEREISVSNVKEVMECGRFNKVYDWTGTTIRLFQARIFKEMMDEEDAYLTGFGINNTKEKIIEKQKHYNLWQGYYEYNFHNQYIQTFAELGIFGLLLIFVLLGTLLREYIRTRDMLVLSFFLIATVIFLTETYIWRQRGLYHFLILFCLFIASNNPVKSEKR